MLVLLSLVASTIAYIEEHYSPAELEHEVGEWYRFWGGGMFSIMNTMVTHLSRERFLLVILSEAKELMFVS